MEYWIIINNEKIGPLTLSQIGGYDVTANTLVWHRGLTDWVHAETLPELRSVIRPQYAPGGTAPTGTYANPYGTDAPLCPPNYLAWSIVVTLLCCQVTGIVAIIYSSMVDSRYRRGDYQGALSASRTAKGWMIASIVVGACGSVVYGALVACGVLGSLL